MRYLNSDLEYIEPVVAGKIHSISYSDKGCFTFKSGNPTEAEAGSNVSVIVTDNHDSYISGSGEWEFVGWINPGTTVSTYTDLNDYYHITDDGDSTYQFIMPDNDVTVYTYCGGGQHSTPSVT